MAILRASGATFDVDVFLNDCPLPISAVYYRGEPELPTTRPDGRRCEHSGVNIPISDVSFAELPRQVQDTIAFLRTHATESRRLREFPGVEGVTLDFGIPRREVVVQCDHFPAELVWLAGSLGLGIELSQYPVEGSGDTTH